MLHTSFPETIQDCQIDYNKTAEQNLEHYVEQRLCAERKLVRGTFMAKIDASFESHKTVIALGVGAVVMSVLLFYEQTLKSDGLEGEVLVLVLGYFLGGVGMLWYCYGKITTEQRIKKEIEQSATYYYTKAFFKRHWLAMRCLPIAKQLEVGFQKVERQQENWWVERTANEEQYGTNIPVGIANALQEKKRLKEVTQQFYSVLQESTNVLIKHQQTNAPDINQEKAFYVSQINNFERLAEEFEKMPTSFHAEKVLQKLLNAVEKIHL